MSSATPSHSGFTIGWICALHTEYTAAKVYLDQTYDANYKDRRDNNDYTLGQIGNHNVVIAVCPDSEYGIASAANVARDMVRSFPTVRMGLMVGVGAGIPSKTNDIRLGDVVVSSSAGQTGPVIQFDMGKRLPDGTFKITSHLDNPPSPLRAAVNGLRSKHDIEGNCIQTMVDQALTNIFKRSKYSRPPEETDKLFSETSLHLPDPDRGDECSNTCSGPDTIVVKRDVRGEEDENPVVHYGPIGSSNTLLRDAAKRDELARLHHILCIEMEAAGLMNHWPCLVIRGICDYADSHKNKRWQGYAAMTAAAYAKSLPLRLPADKVQELQSISATLEGIATNITAVVAQQEQMIELQKQHHNEVRMRELTADQSKCWQAFKKDKDYQEFKDINDKRIENTVLAKSLVDDDIRALSPQKEVKICHFFFKDNEEQNKLTTALCCILHQLYDQERDLLEKAIPAWRRSGVQMLEESATLWSILEDSCSGEFDIPIICVFDALDESTQIAQTKLIGFLGKFVSKFAKGHQSRLKVIVTSRPYDNIEEGLSEAVPADIAEIHLRGEDENDQIHEEIDRVIDARMETLAKKCHLKPATSIRLKITLKAMENRTYLWLFLVYKDIEAQIKDALDADQCEVEPIPKPNAMTVLKIVVGARRPLSLEEMSVALKLATETHSQTGEEVHRPYDMLKVKIRRWCGLFVFCKDDKLYLLHQTAKDFLLRSFTLSETISSRALESQTAVIIPKPFIGTFFRYAARTWAEHHRNAGPSSIVTTSDLFTYIYNCDHPNYQAWVTEYVSWAVMEFRCFRYGFSYTPVQLAAQFGDDTSLEEMLLQNPGMMHAEKCLGSVTTFDDCSRTRISFHHRAFAKSWSRPRRTKDQFNDNALCSAVSNRQADVVQLLLDKGADIDADAGVARMACPDPDYDNMGTSIYTALAGGHVETAQLLFDRGFRVDARSAQYSNTLNGSVLRGQAPIVKHLLNAGAEVDLMLDSGIDVNAETCPYGTAVDNAVEGNHPEIVDLSLDAGAGAKDEARGPERGNVLYRAIKKGHIGIVKLMLDRGADIVGKIGSQGNALDAALSIHHLAIVKILLDAGSIPPRLPTCPECEKILKLAKKEILSREDTHKELPDQFWKLPLALIL
ncbi:hypothetical protein KVT40_005519 [Elsinoe batatas]|uniref:Nucleoside phosphorylase domain-containing protein n=1 Tax=Elsinoe batatas TaxID=2601811 RepID=A0A8K0L1A2_9PEZI|nr:hypothetical protein KVT40_005519 [Elsinoe batatas]